MFCRLDGCFVLYWLVGIILLDQSGLGVCTLLGAVVTLIIAALLDIISDIYSKWSPIVDILNL